MNTTATLFLGKILCEKKFSRKTALLSVVVDNPSEFEELVSTLSSDQKKWVQEWLLDRWKYLRRCLDNLNSSTKDVDWIKYEDSLITETGQVFDKETFLEELGSAALFEPEWYFEDFTDNIMGVSELLN